jgi:hypothetical protein
MNLVYNETVQKVISPIIAYLHFYRGVGNDKEEEK